MKYYIWFLLFTKEAIFHSSNMENISIFFGQYKSILIAQFHIIMQSLALLVKGKANTILGYVMYDQMSIANAALYIITSKCISHLEATMLSQPRISCGKYIQLSHVFFGFSTSLSLEQISHPDNIYCI